MAEWPEKRLFAWSGAPDGPWEISEEAASALREGASRPPEIETYVPLSRLSEVEAERDENEGVYKAWRRRAEEAEGRVDNLQAQLAECYRASGADPDGDSDAHLAKGAVQAVRELRKECREEAERADRLQATLEALVGAAERVLALRMPTGPNPATSRRLYLPETDEARHALDALAAAQQAARQGGEGV